ncbi:hypothetical protein PGT21_003214 [Puccinia graminis f. sp. tritici]|uniref:3-carboxymuconate cyclase n=1 Tax=Puccinia graminis f. sp. tritici TaxID=56615 RepID=A0A5B0Q9T4_PUCGR|nr:hypothetical protein PGT21_003214 [Puccinia graminis f. sp. tritici]
MNNLILLCSLVCLAGLSQICSAQATTKAASATSTTLKIFVGGDQGQGISVFTFDTVKGTLTPQAQGRSDALGPSPIWFEFDKAKKLMISTSAEKFDGKEKTGGVFSAAVAADGTLKKISSTETDEAPVSLEISPDEKLVMVASFNGGSVTTYDLNAGKLSAKPTKTFKFQIKKPGPVAERQTQAAAHQVKLDPAGKLLLVPDLGMDKVHMFSLVSDGKTTSLAPQRDIPIDAGCGPRHLVFDPKKIDRPTFYLLCELSSQLLMIEITDNTKGKIIEKHSVLPPNAKNTFNAAEIIISPDGKFLYTTNRQKDKAGKEEDNIFSIFARDLDSGKLTPKGTSPTGGKGPRHCALSPDANASFMVVANQDSNQISVHKRDPQTGALTFVKSADTKSPAIAVFQA